MMHFEIIFDLTWNANVQNHHQILKPQVRESATPLVLKFLQMEGVPI